jgi:hypothetical protein
MKTIIVRAELQNLAKREILEMVPADTIARIKETDAKPEFKVYCVGHEGVANAQELSFGAKVVKAYHYVKNMIFKIGERLQFGTPAFNGHGDTNDHSGREQVGELVGKAVKMVGDKLSALAVTYIYPQFRKLDLDIASIESEVEYIPKGVSSGDIIDVHKITGIALGSSKVNTPAFPGASCLGVLQAFSKDNRKTEDKMDKQEIIDAIREAGLKITDLYTSDEIVASEPAKKAKQTEYEHAKRIEKSLADEREKVITLTKSLEEKDGKIKDLSGQVSQTQASSLFTKSAEDRKLNDTQKSFIQRRLSGFKSDKSGEELKLDFERYIDAEIKEFGEVAKVMGIKVENPEIDPATGKPKVDAGVPNDDGKGGGGSAEDLSDPSKNDFIPKE